MRGMRLPRYSLRTFLIVTAIIGSAMGWVAYQLNWIRQRHEFLFHNDHPPGPMYQTFDKGAAWPLNLFGEQGYLTIMTGRRQMERAKALFPEADIMRLNREW
jgi:hypothetical protein